MEEIDESHELLQLQWLVREQFDNGGEREKDKARDKGEGYVSS